MSDTVTMTIDGVEIEARAGLSILEAAQDAGVYIPRLCWKEGLEAWGGCRVCMVLANGRAVASCTQPVQDGIGKAIIHTQEVADGHHQQRGVDFAVLGCGFHYSAPTTKRPRSSPLGVTTCTAQERQGS